MTDPTFCGGRSVLAFRLRQGPVEMWRFWQCELRGIRTRFPQYSLTLTMQCLRKNRQEAFLKLAEHSVFSPLVQHQVWLWIQNSTIIERIRNKLEQHSHQKMLDSRLAQGRAAHTVFTSKVGRASHAGVEKPFLSQVGDVKVFTVIAPRP